MVTFTLVNDIKNQIIKFKYSNDFNDILKDFNNLEFICKQYNWDYINDRFRIINQYGGTMYIYIYNNKLNSGYWLNILRNLEGYELAQIQI